MKSILAIILIFSMLSFLSVSCNEGFLEIPDTTGTIDLEQVYSSEIEAEKALMGAYRETLTASWPAYPKGGFNGAGALGAISGERSRGLDWHETVTFVQSGLSPTFTSETFSHNWEPIRMAYLVHENVDVVPDMSNEMKQYYKGESLALVAYRYLNMFIRYGGLPLVEKAFLPDDDLDITRSSLQETLDFITGLCDESIELLPDSWPTTYYGRFTKGAAMSIKARALLFAARPLYNSSTPYLDFGENNNLISFGTQDINRWNEAITVYESVLTWASQNGYELINTGGAGADSPNPNSLEDYGTATSTPGNREVLLAFKQNENNTRLGVYYNSSGSQPDQGWETAGSGLVSNFLRLYYSKDGTTPDWPEVGEASARPASDYLEKIENMESRLRLDYVLPGVGTLNNPGVPAWTLNAGFPKTVANYAYEDLFPSTAEVGGGAGLPAKFYYNAGNRPWFEPPLFRLAETHLSLAEAYNEIGNTAKALEHLNMVHNRAGLPSITITDQDELRRSIWREKAIEFVAENHRYFDVRHWKHPEIDDGIIGGQFSELQFWTTEHNRQFSENFKTYWDANTYVGFWHPKMHLEPFPQNEVNKGFLLQNPGY